jgi:16S rRNA (cytosine1402-N4)-methyltransferase
VMGQKWSEPGHKPVMAAQVVAFLATVADGAYLDLTVGLGGHLKALSEALGDRARLYGVDKDAGAIERAEKNLAQIRQACSLEKTSYADVEDVVRRLEDRLFDGVLLDLGLSSYQLDDPGRGFSYRFDSPLDMRFDECAGGKTAADLVNDLSEREIARIFRTFGEERNAARLAKAIVRERQKEMIRTTAQLADLVSEVTPPPHRVKSQARVFQALRIAVNDELGQLEAVLPKLPALLKPHGRLAVIAYHSLEDRQVKRFFQREAKGCICPPQFPTCVCGRKPRLKIVTRKVVVPSPDEINANPRARSARLRVAEKLPS